ncbi:hypothetical protein ACFL5C_03445, partial [Candidatus Omnitrophota bacterium]
LYKKRHIEAFGKDALTGVSLVFWQQSAVGRDLLPDILEGMGAMVYREEPAEEGEFIPIDTENITEKELAIAGRLMKKHGQRVLMTTDGDSDRPAMFVLHKDEKTGEEKVKYIPGDKLGVLAAMYLKADFLAVPITANHKALEVLKDKGVQVVSTDVGSPYVADAMQKSKKERKVGFEVNGGFLVGSNLAMPNGSILKELPTRDALLPMICARLLAKEKGMDMYNLVETTFSGKYAAETSAGLVENLPESKQVTVGCENYTRDMGPKVIKSFTPQKTKSVAEVTFDAENKVRYRLKGAEEEIAANDGLTAEVNGIRERLQEYLAGITGLDKARIVKINFQNGVRVYLSRKEGDEMVEEVVHLRPSGNAAQFRMYALAKTQERANKIIEDGTRPETGVLVRVINGVGKSAPEPTITTESTRTSVGMYSVSSMQQPAPGSDLDYIIKTILKGDRPINVEGDVTFNPWGAKEADGLSRGEIHLGEPATVIIDGEEALLDDVMKYIPEEVLGKTIVYYNGIKMPLVKILTPDAWLSVQVHPDKDETWIFLTGGEIVLGFNEKHLKEEKLKTEEEVKKAYSGAVNNYIAKRNELVDALVNAGYSMDELKSTPEKSVNLEEKAKGKEISVVDFNKAKEAVDKFHNHMEVEAGQVVAIPRGTIHALGPKVNIIEPQVPGKTLRVMDVEPILRDTHPDEAIKAINPYAKGEVDMQSLREDAKVKVERLPGGFENKGLEVHRITFKETAELEFSDVTSFHTMLAIGGKAWVEIAGKRYEIPEAQAMTKARKTPVPIIPANVGSYKIIAEKGVQIIDTFSPVPEAWKPSLPMASASLPGPVGGNSYSLNMEILDYKTVTDTIDILTVTGGQSAPSPAAIEGREHVLRVMEGEIKVKIGDKEEVLTKESSLALDGKKEYTIV